MNDRQTKMLAVTEAGFVLNDLSIYLDTHPCCPHGLATYAAACKNYETQVYEYEQCFGPLTANSAIDTTKWSWVQLPWPWEMEG